MDAPVLGHVLIVNNLASGFPRSMADVQALLEAYGSLGFRVHVHTSCDSEVCFQWRELTIPASGGSNKTQTRKYSGKIRA